MGSRTTCHKPSGQAIAVSVASASLLKLPYEGGAWIHLLGFVLTCSSYYYLRAAKKGNLDFALATVHTRLAAPIVVIGLYISDQADWHFLSFGLIDGFGGLWTLFELKKALKK